MPLATFLDSGFFTWGLLPALIFFARICDMSLDTIRIIMVGRGHKGLAACLGFFEVTIWLLVARQVIVNLPNPLCFFAYSAGFAAGNYAGMWIEERLSSGARIIRIIVSRESAAIIDAIKAEGCGFTVIPGQGSQGPVDVIFTIVDRRQVKRVIALIERVDPQVFYTIEDTRYVSEGVFPPKRSRWLDLSRHK